MEDLGAGVQGAWWRSEAPEGGKDLRYQDRGPGLCPQGSSCHGRVVSREGEQALQRTEWSSETRGREAGEGCQLVWGGH